jgi:hypothetical protein
MACDGTAVPEGPSSFIGGRPFSTPSQAVAWPPVIRAGPAGASSTTALWLAPSPDPAAEPSREGTTIDVSLRGVKSSKKLPTSNGLFGMLRPSVTPCHPSPRLAILIPSPPSTLLRSRSAIPYIFTDGGHRFFMVPVLWKTKKIKPLLFDLLVLAPFAGGKKRGGALLFSLSFVGQASATAASMEKRVFSRLSERTARSRREAEQDTPPPKFVVVDYTPTPTGPWHAKCIFVLGSGVRTTVIMGMLNCAPVGQGKRIVH